VQDDGHIAGHGAKAIECPHHEGLTENAADEIMRLRPSLRAQRSNP
jgi:hypothetical protein